jgi:uncharacterized protein YkwD
VRVVVGLIALGVVGCTTAAPPTTTVATESVDTTALPAWLHASSVVRDAALEEAAALLCARDTDAVIDDDARHAAKIVDGQLVGLLKKAKTPEAAEALLAHDAAPLLGEKHATHAGAVVGATPSGEACAAVVGARRLIDATAPPASLSSAGSAIALSVRVPSAKSATLFVLKPDGFVDKTALPAVDGAQKLSVPAPLAGRYALEIVVDNSAGASDPEVALLWPLRVGAPKEPPFPEVLFPDEGHDDTALTHRAEALVQRLRNEELIEPFKVSPALVDVAAGRAHAVAQRGSLGHRLPGGDDVADDLRAKFANEPRAQFLKLAEVQAQASTLADAWQALLDSPAHRYVLVDTSYTHCGVAVARGKDAAGRATVNLIALLGRRLPQREVEETREDFLEAANESRDKRGLAALQDKPSLDKVAMRLAGAMRDLKRVDENLLGDPVANVALQTDASLTKVKPLVARTDDPMFLLNKGVPPMLMELDATHMGLGFAVDASEGAFYVVILAAQ